MSINSIINAEKYSEELDRVFAQKSVTGFFADNALATKFVGAKTVIIPDIDFQGLADYDRNNGYSKGAITVSNVSHTMSMDRARSLQIDREDMDETGIANLAGKILGEYVRTKVVPECDAYVLSKLSKIAIDKGNYFEDAEDAPIATLFEMINKIQSKAGFDCELVAFVNGPMYARMQSSDELSKMITVSDFKQGDINLQVKTLNGVAILPVVSERMKSEFVFSDDENGGFAPAKNARDIYMLVCPKNAVHLVKKTESMRIFTPEQNLDADAYKFDYRIYYDAFVNKSGLETVYAWLSPDVSISFEMEDQVVDYGTTVSLEAHISTTDSAVYKWYRCSDKNGSNPKLISESDMPAYILQEGDYSYGECYYFARIYINDMTYLTTRVITFTFE